MNLFKIKIMGKKEKKQIGFKQNYQIEADKLKEEPKEEENINKEEEKGQAALEAMAKLTGQFQMSTNEILISTKLKMYVDLIKSEEFIIKTLEEKEAFIGELLFLQSLSTEMTTLKSQMQSVINK